MADGWKPGCLVRRPSKKQCVASLEAADRPSVCGLLYCSSLCAGVSAIPPLSVSRLPPKARRATQRSQIVTLDTVQKSMILHEQSRPVRLFIKGTLCETLAGAAMLDRKGCERQLKLPSCARQAPKADALAHRDTVARRRTSGMNKSTSGEEVWLYTRFKSGMAGEFWRKLICVID